MFLLLKILLSPLLIVQALHIRRTALVLPEPKGARDGVCGSGPRLRVLVLGDSSAAGVGVETQAKALSGQLVRRLSPDFGVEWTLIAKTGATTMATFQTLRDHPAKTFDLAVIALGVNDVTRAVSPRRFHAAQTDLRNLLKTKFAVKHSIHTGLPPMGEFPALPQPVRWIVGRDARLLDQSLQSFAAAAPDRHYLSLDLPLDARLMASDGYHPGPEVYALWAEEAACMVRELAPRLIAQETGGKLATNAAS